MLGQEFVQSLVAFSLSHTHKGAYLKIAMVAANLVSEKITDGVSKLILKADVDRLKSVDKKAQSALIDSSIKEAWNLADQAVEQGHMSQDDFDDTVGKYMIRTILFACDKQKLGPEGREFESLQEVKSEFVKEIRSRAPDSRIDFGEWAVLVDANPDAKSVHEAPKTLLMQSIAEQSDPTNIMEKNGFSVEQFVHEKVSPGHVFKIQSIVGEDAVSAKVTLCKFVLNGENPLKVELSLQCFLDGWTQHKAKLEQTLSHPEEQCDQIEQDDRRCQVFLSQGG